MGKRERCSYEVNQRGDFMNESHIISWIAQEKDVKIDVAQELTRRSKDEICSEFEEALYFDGIKCKRVFTISSEKLKDLVCQV